MTPHSSRWLRLKANAIGTLVGFMIFLPFAVASAALQERSIDAQKAQWNPPIICNITGRGEVFDGNIGYYLQKVTVTCPDGQSYTALMHESNAQRSQTTVYTSRTNRNRYYVGYDVTNRVVAGNTPAYGSDWPLLMIPGGIAALMLGLWVESGIKRRHAQQTTIKSNSQTGVPAPI